MAIAQTASVTSVNAPASTDARRADDFQRGMFRRDFTSTRRPRNAHGHGTALPHTIIAVSDPGTPAYDRSSRFHARDAGVGVDAGVVAHRGTSAGSAGRRPFDRTRSVHLDTSWPPSTRQIVRCRSGRATLYRSHRAR